MGQSKALEAQGAYLSAVAKLNEQIRDNPQDGELRFHLGRNYLLLFDGPAAEHAFRKAGELGIVQGGRVALGLGRSLVMQRKYREVGDAVKPSAAFESEVLASVHALRGSAFLVLDQIAESINELVKANKLASNNSDVMLLRAQQAVFARGIEEAQSIIEKVFSSDSSNVAALTHKAELLAIQGRTEQAIAAFAEALRIQPKNLDALLRRAILLISRDRLPDAEKDVETLRKFYGRNPSTVFLQGQLHYWRREYREALDLAQRALKANAKDTNARLLSGMANLALGSAVHAEFEFAHYLTETPRNTPVRRVLIDLRSELSAKTDAVQALASILSQELRNALKFSIHDDIYLRVAQRSRIADWLEWYVTTQPLDVLAGARYLERRFAVEEIELAIADLARSAGLRTKVSAADSALVVACLARRQYVRAADAALAMEKKSPESAEAASFAGIVYRLNNRKLEAVEQFGLALKRDPAAASSLFNLAEIEQAEGKQNLARKRFQDVLAAHGDNVRVLLAFARFEEGAGRLKDALGLIERAARINGDAYEAKVGMVRLLARTNDPVRAAAVAEEALSHSPSDPVAIELAAETRKLQADYRGAVALYAQLVKMFPRIPEGHYKLASAQFQAGLKSEAGASLEKSLALPLNDPDQLRTQVSLSLLYEDRTFEAIEKTRKVYKPMPRQPGSARAGFEIWNVQPGGDVR